MEEALERIKEKLLEISRIGEDETGGISRVFGSKAMEKGQEEIRKYFEESGLFTYMDSAGNMHGIFPCGKENAKEILIGSHLDTVKQGGRFDGLLGIIAGVECTRMIQKEGIILNNDIHVIATNGEEGNELGGTFGSRAMMGLLPLDSDVYLNKAESFGYSRDDLQNALLDVSRTKCYLELHIEQGSTLYNHQEQIGIVTGIVGLRRYKITVYGASNHAGTTMMEDRNDALVSAARIIVMGDVLARNMGHHFVETVGILQVYPGSAPVIPGKVEMILEIRSESEEQMDRYMEKYSDMAKKIAMVTIEEIVKKQPVKCDMKLADMMESICQRETVAYRRMPSGATHDGNAMAAKVPISMIFVPSRDGISHAKEEWTDWQDIGQGVKILMATIKKLDETEDMEC